MIAHQAKRLDIQGLLEFRDRFDLPLDDNQVRRLEFVKPSNDSAAMRYLLGRCHQLGGFLPKRFSTTMNQLPNRPPMTVYAKSAIEANGKHMSTTMALVRIIGGLLRDKQFGKHLVPIVADEARIFGMQTLFHQIGIYSPLGQTYEPEDASSVVSYKEAKDGQLLEEGISEAGAISSWTAAATAYSAHNIELLPIYIFYSIFGFQRIGDLIWAAADQRARGFLFGATAGRTTLSGEGLQHQDGSSHLIAATIPNCRAYDPCFAHELAVIVEYGVQRMYDEQHDELFCITLMNENYSHPSLPNGIEEDIIRGMYLYESFGDAAAPRERLLGSGTILKQVIEAAHHLTGHFEIHCEIYSVTSFSELARDPHTIERAHRLTGDTEKSQITKYLNGSDPIVCATDYVRSVPSQISPYLSAPFQILGTDGFGRSANRQALRDFFEVSAAHIAFAAVTALIDTGALPHQSREQAIKAFAIETSVSTPAPWNQ